MAVSGGRATKSNPNNLIVGKSGRNWRGWYATKGKLDSGGCAMLNIIAILEARQVRESGPTTSTSTPPCAERKIHPVPMQKPIGCGFYPPRLRHDCVCVYSGAVKLPSLSPGSALPSPVAEFKHSRSLEVGAMLPDTMAIGFWVSSCSSWGLLLH